MFVLIYPIFCKMQIVNQVAEKADLHEKARHSVRAWSEQIFFRIQMEHLFPVFLLLPLAFCSRWTADFNAGGIKTHSVVSFLVLRSAISRLYFMSFDINYKIRQQSRIYSN